MSLDPKDYLEIARFLKSDASKGLNKEACLRTSLGRAYYAALLYARNYAEDNSRNFRAGRASFHSDIRKWYKIQGNIEVDELLNDLQIWRNACDYDREVAFNLERQVGLAIEISEEIMRKCHPKRTH